MSERGVNVLLQLETTYQCKIGFPALTAIKTKYRNSRLSLCPIINLRLCLSQKRAICTFTHLVNILNVTQGPKNPSFVVFGFFLLNHILHCIFCKILFTVSKDFVAN